MEQNNFVYLLIVVVVVAVVTLVVVAVVVEVVAMKWKRETLEEHSISLWGFLQKLWPVKRYSSKDFSSNRSSCNPIRQIWRYFLEKSSYNEILCDLTIK